MKRTLYVSSLSALALTGALIAPAQPVEAAESCPRTSKVSVLFVHGFNENSRVWASMSSRLSKLAGISIPAPFDYSKEGLNRKWVTNPAIGAELAKEINCQAEASKSEKAVVIAHSMGGLAVLQAIKEDPSIKNKLGAVITIGTPNQGSEFAKSAIGEAAQFCRSIEKLPGVQPCSDTLRVLLGGYDALPALAADSKQVRALPAWPDTVPVLAIAGNIRPKFAIPIAPNPIWGTLAVHGPYSGTDGMVATSSALHNNEINGLGGKFEYKCTTEWPVVLPIITPADCEHNALLRSDKVKKRVVAEVRDAIAQLAPSPSKPSSRPTESSQPSQSASNTNPACPPPSATVESEVGRYNESHGFDRSKQIIETVCKGGWAVVRIKMESSYGGVTSVGFIVLQHVGSSWPMVAAGSDSSVCNKIPANLRFGMCA